MYFFIKKKRKELKLVWKNSLPKYFWAFCALIMAKLRLAVKKKPKKYLNKFSFAISFSDKLGKHWPRVFTYTIVDYGLYTTFGYHTFLLSIKDMQSFRQIGLKLWNMRSDSKSISDSAQWDKALINSGSDFLGYAYL